MTWWFTSVSASWNAQPTSMYQCASSPSIHCEYPTANLSLGAVRAQFWGLFPCLTSGLAKMFSLCWHPYITLHSIHHFYQVFIDKNDGYPMLQHNPGVDFLPRSWYKHLCTCILSISPLRASAVSFQKTATSSWGHATSLNSLGHVQAWMYEEEQSCCSSPGICLSFSFTITSFSGKRGMK